MPAPSVRQALLAAREASRCAFIPYLTLGHPHLEGSLALLEALEEWGADTVEIGVPFSDPVADGPTIQRTIETALRGGTTLRVALERLRPSPTGRPRVLFSYLNPLLAYGLEALPAALEGIDVGAVLVTDLIPEEADEWRRIAAAGSVETCFLVASTSTEERLRRAMEASTGFVYCVSTLGVTGARRAVDRQAADTVERLRGVGEVPVAVGFGISTPEDVRAVAAYADGVVVGSALLDALGDATDPPELLRRARAFVEPLLEACGR